MQDIVANTPSSIGEQLVAATPKEPTSLQVLADAVQDDEKQAVGAREAQLATWDRVAMCKYIGLCIVALQLHVHSHTCAKNGHRGDDMDCRMMYPRCLIQASIILGTAHLLLRRDHPNIVPFNPAVMLAMPFNHAIYVLADQSRWARRKQLYDEAVAKGNTSLVEPTLFSMVVEAFLAACYASKYQTKVDATGVNAPIMDVAKVSGVRGEAINCSSCTRGKQILILFTHITGLCGE